MRYTLPLLCVLLVPAMAAAGSDGELVIQGDMSPLNDFPTFNHGYLAAYGADGITVYGPNGLLTMKIPRRAGWTFVNVDMDSDGSVAIAAHRGATNAIIAMFKSDGSPDREILTGPYLPSDVCFAPDHSLWVLGSEDWVPEAPPEGYSLLRHYSRGGELLAEAFPRASFPPDALPAEPRLGFWKLRIAGGRIGIKLNRAGANKRQLWLEADLDGKETGRWTAPFPAEPAAMTASGDVYAQADPDIVLLDRATGTWKPVTQSTVDRLLGAEGDTLVFKIHGMNAIRRAAQP